VRLSKTLARTKSPKFLKPTQVHFGKAMSNNRIGKIFENDPSALKQSAGIHAIG